MAKKLAFDRILFGTVMVLVGLGLAMVFSASAVVGGGGSGRPNALVVKQVVAAVAGLVAMGFAMHVSYDFWRRKWVVYGAVLGVIALQAAALASPARNATHRWLYVGGVSIQPSEFAKVALVIYIAYQIGKREDGRIDLRYLMPAGVVAGVIAGLVLISRDLGGALMLASATGLLLFLAGLPWLYLTLGALGLSPVIATAVLLEPYRRDRLLSFLDPEKDPQGLGFQAHQSLIAVGSGGLLGLGLGEGLQKLHFLPYPHSDFVFAILAEELGLVGALGVVALFAVFLWRGIRAGARAPDAFGRYLAWGLTATVVIQALIHISVALSLAPTTGVTLPFISYGGSSLVVCLASAGLILNVSQHG